MNTAIDCSNPTYRSAAAAVAFFCFVYLSIPIVWFILLYKVTFCPSLQNLRRN